MILANDGLKLTRSGNHYAAQGPKMFRCFLLNWPVDLRRECAAFWKTAARGFCVALQRTAAQQRRPGRFVGEIACRFATAQALRGQEHGKNDPARAVHSLVSVTAMQTSRALH
jgi:hypothetical protein